jgi:hypothetical protein
MRVRFAVACALLAAVGLFVGCTGDAAPSGEVPASTAPLPPPATKVKGPGAKVKVMPSAPAGALPKPAN